MRKKRNPYKKKLLAKHSSVKRFIAAAVMFCAVVVALLTATVFYRRYEEDKRKQAVLKSMIPPYYDPKVFFTPKDILQSRLSQDTIKIPARFDIPVLMYHYVEYVKDLDDIVKIKLDILPHVFESQIKTLHDNNFKTYFVKDIPEIINSNIIPSKKSVVLTFDDGYEDFYTVVYPILKKYQMKATVYVIYDYIGWKGFMNESQIKEIASSNLVEIGSHTLDHVYLKSVVKDLAEKQIKNSKVLLEQMFGFPVYTFAFPYGAFSQESLDIVKEAGYTAAVSVISGSEQSETNLFYLSRLRPGIFNSRFASQIVNTK